MNAIEVNNVTKIYKLYKSSRDRLSEIIRLNQKKYHHAFHALNDVSFTIKKGETVGVIGHNGSGKSSLLKIICGVTKPTSGTVKVNGRISSLLELGAGFHPDFTGRENVYMNGALMGFSREEMQRRFPEIEAFADIGEFINQPVKTYSSGMYMRLAFSTAISVDPDILIIDEILAVGDEDFQNKCLQKIQEVRQIGKTIILVSHSTGMLENICERIYLLHHGNCIVEGKPVDVFPVYHRILYGKDILGQVVKEESGNITFDNVQHTDNSVPRSFRSWGTKEVEITDVYFIDKNSKQKSDGVFKTNERFVVRIEFKTTKKVIKPNFGIAIYSATGALVNGTNSKNSNLGIPFIEGMGVVEYSVEALSLLPGKYYFSAAIVDSDSFFFYDHWEKCLTFITEPSEKVRGQTGILFLSEQWSFPEVY